MRDACEGKAPDHKSDSSFSLPGPISEPPSFSGPPYTPDFWSHAIGEATIHCFIVQYADKNALGIDNYLSDYGIELDTEHQIEDETAISHLLELMNRKPVEVLDEVNITEPPSFHTSTRPGTRLPPPLEMPQRPSTISMMKDNVNFDISEFFDDDAALDSPPSVPQSTGPAMPDGDPSADDMLPSDTTGDKFDPAVSFEEYLRLLQSQEAASAWTQNSFEKHGYQALPFACAGTGFGSAGHQEFENRGADYSDGFKNAFKAGREDSYLPAILDPVYDEEFAAFAAAGPNVIRQFRDIGQEFKSHKAAATATPSPSRVSCLQAPELSPASQKGDDFTRAGQIYVAHVLQQNPELAVTPEETTHSYTEEEIEWARNCLPDDVKVWMKHNCGMVGAEKPTPKRLENALEKVAPEPKLIFKHTAVPSSQKPEEQLPKATVDNLNHQAKHDKLMSLSELDMEWDAFEETHSPAQTVLVDLQSSATLPNAALTLQIVSPASARSFVTAPDDKMSMIPTIATPNRFMDAPNKSPLDTVNKTFSPKAGASASGDLSLVTKLSKVVLDKAEERTTRSVSQGVETNSIGESVGHGSRSDRMSEEEAHSNEMDRLIDQYGYGLHGHRSQACDDCFGIGEVAPAPIHIREFASKLDKPAHPKNSDAQPNQENAGLSVNPRNTPGNDEEVPAGHNSPMSISDDEQEAVEDHNSPMSISHDEKAVAENQIIPKVTQNHSRPVGENEVQNIVKAKQETGESPWTVTESTSPTQLVHSRRPDLGTEQSTGKDISFTSEVSAPSPRLPTSSLSDSAAVLGTPLFTCIKCNQVYKKKAYLMKHEAKGNCKPKSPKLPRVPVFAGIPTMKLSMTDQEFVDNGLPSVQSRNWRNFSYCTACDMEFSNISRLRLHLRQSCPILRENGVYNQPQNQQLAIDNQALARRLSKSTTTGNL